MIPLQKVQICEIQ